MPRFQRFVAPLIVSAMAMSALAVGVAQAPGAPMEYVSLNAELTNLAGAAGVATGCPDGTAEALGIVLSAYGAGKGLTVDAVVCGAVSDDAAAMKGVSQWATREGWQVRSPWTAGNNVYMAWFSGPDYAGVSHTYFVSVGPPTEAPSLFAAAMGAQ